MQATASTGGRFTVPAARARLLESALDSLSEAVVIVDEEEQPVYENAAAKAGNVNARDTTFILTKEARIPRPDTDDGAGTAAPLTVRVYSSLTRHPVAERIINAQRIIVGVRGVEKPLPSAPLPGVGSLEFASSALQEETGKTAEELAAGRAFADLHPDDVATVVEFARQRVRNVDANGQSCQFRIKMRDGQYRWQMFFMEPVRNDFGTVVKWVNTGMNIDEMKTTKAQLIEQRTLLETVLDQLPVRVRERRTPHHACKLCLRCMR